MMGLTANPARPLAFFTINNKIIEVRQFFLIRYQIMNKNEKDKTRCIHGTHGAPEEIHGD